MTLGLIILNCTWSCEIKWIFQLLDFILEYLYLLTLFPVLAHYTSWYLLVCFLCFLMLEALSEICYFIFFMKYSQPTMLIQKKELTTLPRPYTCVPKVYSYFFFFFAQYLTSPFFLSQWHLPRSVNISFNHSWRVALGTESLLIVHWLWTVEPPKLCGW